MGMGVRRGLLLSHFSVIVLSLHQSAASHHNPFGHLHVAAGADGSLLPPVPQIPKRGEILVSNSTKHPRTNTRGQCADAGVAHCDPSTHMVGESRHPVLSSAPHPMATHIRPHRITRVVT